MNTSPVVVGTLWYEGMEKEDWLKGELKVFADLEPGEKPLKPGDVVEIRTIIAMKVVAVRDNKAQLEGWPQDCTFRKVVKTL